MIGSLFRPTLADTSQHPASYYAATAGKPPASVPLAGDLSVDVCVIGAGFTGLGAALHLAENGYRVVVLDQARVGWGASGRNGGHASVGMRQPQDVLERLMGPTTAMDLWRLSLDARASLRGLMSRYAIDCEFKLGMFRLDHKAGLVAGSHRYAELLRLRYGYDDIRPVDQAEARCAVGSLAYFGGTFDAGSGHLHPLKLAFGMARALQSNGGQIHEQSKVLAVDEQGDRVLVRTDQGVVKARFAIIAGDALLRGIDAGVEARSMPINTYVLATEPLDPKLAESLIAKDAAVVDSKFVVNYYRLSSDKRLLFGGGETYTYRTPRDIGAFVRRPMLEIFPQLKSTRIDYGWGGAVGITVNRLPYVRRLNSKVFVSAGYSGRGVVLAPYFGKLLGEAVSGSAGGLDILSKLPSTKFPGGDLLRWPILVASMSYFALRDRL